MLLLFNLEKVLNCKEDVRFLNQSLLLHNKNEKWNEKFTKAKFHLITGNMTNFEFSFGFLQGCNVI